MSNYVLTTNLVCHGCGESEAVPFDTGKPLDELEFPLTLSKDFICSNCGPQGPMSVTLSKIRT